MTSASSKDASPRGLDSSSRTSRARLGPFLRWANPLLWTTTLLVGVADQFTKAWAVEALAPTTPARMVRTPVVHVIPGCLRFEYAENTGAAFSLFQEHPGVLTAIAMVLAVGVLAWSYLLPTADRLGRIGLAMVLGGAVGNLIDRFRFGYVVDFILAYAGRYAWPTFNIADSAICVGIGLFFLSSFLMMRRGQTGEPAPDAAGRTEEAGSLSAKRKASTH